MTQPAVYMMDELAPSQFLELDRTLLRDSLLKNGGTTSHTAILVRLFNIPTLVDVDAESLRSWLQQAIYIDGSAGTVVVTLDEPVVCYCQ